MFKFNDSERQFNSHRSIIIKENRETNENKDQTRIQYVTEFDLQRLHFWDSQPLKIEVDLIH
jgi:secreted Zn-dependent insulinase-like peptidase